MSMSTSTNRWNMNIRTFTTSTINTCTGRMIRRGSRIRIGTGMVSWFIRIHISRIFTIGIGTEKVDGK
jgi:hypothetical protein